MTVRGSRGPTRAAAIALLLALAAWHGAGAQARPRRDGAAREHAAGADSAHALALDRPTIVAFFPHVTDAEIDRNEELASTLDDFAWSLGEARYRIAALGVRVVEVRADTLWFVEGPGVRTWVPPADSGDVGYLLALPGKKPRVRYGVATEEQLVAMARSLVADRPRPRP